MMRRNAGVESCKRAKALITQITEGRREKQIPQRLSPLWNDKTIVASEKSPIRNGKNISGERYEGFTG